MKIFSWDDLKLNGLSQLKYPAHFCSMKNLQSLTKCLGRTHICKTPLLSTKKRKGKNSWKSLFHDSKFSKMRFKAPRPQMERKRPKRNRPIQESTTSFSELCLFLAVGAICAPKNFVQFLVNQLHNVFKDCKPVLVNLIYKSLHDDKAKD